MYWRAYLFHKKIYFSDRRGIQTHNLLIRSQMLYSVELVGHCVCKGTNKMYNYNTSHLFLEPKAGLEPATYSLRMSCSTNWAISATSLPHITSAEDNYICE